MVTYEFLTFKKTYLHMGYDMLSVHFWPQSQTQINLDAELTICKIVENGWSFSSFKE